MGPIMFIKVTEGFLLKPSLPPIAKTRVLVAKPEQS